MKSEELQSVSVFCASHNIDVSFISSLQEAGLIDIKTIKEASYFPSNQLSEIEKFVRFHFDFNINLEGIESINHLLQTIDGLHKEIITLKNELRVYYC